MRRRTVDAILGFVALGLAVVLLVLGVVMTVNANFARAYVKDQLGREKITFKQVGELTESERRASCLVAYAGQPLSTGKQAECYANEFISLHLEGIGGGRTYAELGADQAALRERITAAQRDGSPEVAELQRQLADLTSKRDTVFEGEMLRGALLTSFGFSEFGTKAQQASIAAYGGAAVLLIIAVLALAHAVRTPPSVAFAPVHGGGRSSGAPASGADT